MTGLEADWGLLEAGLESGGRDGSCAPTPHPPLVHLAVASILTLAAASAALLYLYLPCKCT